MLLKAATDNRKFTKKEELSLRLLEELYRNGNKSIPELCKITNMSTPPIARIIDCLVSDNLILDEGIGQSSGGRRPNLYRICPSAGFVLGIDICRYSVRYGLFDLQNSPVVGPGFITEGLDNSADIIGTIKNEVDRYIDGSGIDKNKLLGIGIALPGLINIHSGISYSYLQADKPLSKIFEEQFHYPVFVEHDSKAMALGEQSFGLAKGKQNVLCLNIGTGIGLSMILNGKLYLGNSGFSGEFGHIPIIQNGQLCYCGKIGCLETVASGKALIEIARKKIEEGAITHVLSLVDNNPMSINIQTILDAALMGDQFAISLFASIGEHLGRGIAVLIHLFNPEMIIVGGELSKAGNYLVDPIQQNLNKYTIPTIRTDAQIAVSNLGENAGLLGTVALVMNNLFLKSK
jgi:glucokinase-like ROK family protein